MGKEECLTDGSAQNLNNGLRYWRSSGLVPKIYMKGEGEREVTRD